MPLSNTTAERMLQLKKYQQRVKSKLSLLSQNSRLGPTICSEEALAGLMMRDVSRLELEDEIVD